MTERFRVPLKDQTFLDLTKDSLYQLIAMSPVALGRNTLLGYFDNDARTTSRLDTLLADLILEDKILADERVYRARNPWADIAYATVGPVQTRKRTDVTILNLKSKTIPVVTLSRTDVYKNGLKEGDRIVIGLNRDNNGSAELKARFIARAKGDSNFRLTGIFNQKSHAFTALDRTIKTEFLLDREPVGQDVPRQFVAEMTTHFNIRKPMLAFMPDQNHDMTTGDAISQIILRKHKISATYSEKSLKEAESIARSSVRPGKSVDLRMLDFITVDPPDSVDLDDSFYGEAFGDGFALYTAITDVARHVHYNSSIDREAYERGTTFYLRDHTAHMLPPVLGTKRLSLVADQDRQVIMLRQELGPDGAMKSFDFFPAIIRSRQQLSYGQFYDALHREEPRFNVLSKIHELRRSHGYDKKFDQKLRSGDKFSGKSIIETLMVQYNSLMGRYLGERNIPYLSRNFVQTTDQSAAPRRAYYSSKSCGHADLGLETYGHGSSPLRRYADLFNQRAMHTAFGFRRTGLHSEEIKGIDGIADHLNGRRNVEEAAMHDEEKYHSIRYIQSFEGAPPLRVNIQDIGDNYVDIVIMQTGHRQRLFDSTLSNSTLPANQWKIDGANHQLVLLDGNGAELHRYNRTDTLLGQIHGVDPQNASWQVRLVPHDRFRPDAQPKISLG